MTPPRCCLCGGGGKGIIACRDCMHACMHACTHASPPWPRGGVSPCHAQTLILLLLLLLHSSRSGILGGRRRDRDGGIVSEGTRKFSLCFARERGDEPTSVGDLRGPPLEAGHVCGCAFACVWMCLALYRGYLLKRLEVGEDPGVESYVFGVSRSIWRVGVARNG